MQAWVSKFKKPQVSVDIPELLRAEWQCNPFWTHTLKGPRAHIRWHRSSHYGSSKYWLIAQWVFPKGGQQMCVRNQVFGWQITTWDLFSWNHTHIFIIKKPWCDEVLMKWGSQMYILMFITDGKNKTFL